MEVCVVCFKIMRFLYIWSGSQVVFGMSGLSFSFRMCCSAYFLSVVTAIVIMQFKHGLRFLLILSVAEVNSGLVIMLFFI